MNTLFLIGEALTDSNGISKKILAQVDALKRLGMKVDLSYLESNDKNELIGRCINGERIDKYSKIHIISEFQWRCKYKNVYKYIKEKKIKIVFIRYTHFANPLFISFLEKLKRSNIKVLLEIPTYPYDQEYRYLKFTSRIVLLIEKLSRCKFKNYVTRIITLTPYTSIFGIPSTQINNGIDPDSINMIQNNKSDNDIHLIGVASIAHWHGYDRVIEGLHNYYTENSEKKKVFFHIVGDSSNRESLRYKKLVKKYNLSNYVIFYGKKSGKELDVIFNKADIAVGSLGCHRISINNVKSLKNREYCARGLPFFYSETDVDFENKDFIFRVPGNNNPIDIGEIIKFLSKNKFDSVTIRKYAIENLTWDKQFEKVLNDVFPDFKTRVNSKVCS
ncbi:MAG TPA: glycosyltransferase [Hanamia sp.]|nr:glycosyltransferase [Hanamia sp.]